MSNYEQYLNFPPLDYIQPHKGFSTKAIHAGQNPDALTGAINVPIYYSSTFQQQDPMAFGEFIYSRLGNPTRKALEDCLASLEYGTKGLVFSSGLASIAAVFNILQPSHVILCQDLYGGTNGYSRLFAQEKYKFQIDFVDLTQIDLLLSKMSPNTSMIWLETPTNPLLTIIDIKEICSKVKAINPNCIVGVDNTFCSPYLQSPLNFGADISMNSITKYIGGHADIIMGVVVVKDDKIFDKLYLSSVYNGASPSPMDCFLALRGVKTLAARMQILCKNGYSISKFLESHPLIEKTIYPGLKSHPQHELAKQQMKGFGSMISFYIKGGQEQATKFMKALKIVKVAVSLGGVESLIQSPRMMTHANVPPEQRIQLGITDNLIRLSVGIEELEDLLQDIDDALVACQ